MANLELRISISGQPEKVITMKSRMLVGTLLSNQVVLRATGVDPIHALIEENDKEEWVIIDLDSGEGVQVNGSKVDVETKISIGDEIVIGSATLTVQEKTEVVAVEESAVLVGADAQSKAESKVNSNLQSKVTAAKTEAKVAQTKNSEVEADAPEDAEEGEAAGEEFEADGEEEVSFEPQSVHEEQQQENAIRQATVRSEAASNDKSEESKPASRLERLFSPKKARPSGSVVEVVAYWGDVILEVDHFHPSMKGFETATIGDPTKAHFIAAGDDNFSSHPLVETRPDSYRINMREGMKGKFRQEGKLVKTEGKNRVKMGRRDIAQVEYGPIKYFIMYIRPPVLELPKTGPKDPLLWSLSFVATLIFTGLVSSILILGPPTKKDDPEDDPWAIVNLPEERLKPLAPKPEPKIPEQKIAEVKTPPVKPPPPEPKKEFKPAKPVETEKPKQVKKVETPKAEPTKIDQNPQVAEKPQGADKPAKNTNLDKLSSLGMPSTGAKNPDLKLAGPKIPGPKGAAGGPKSGGLNQAGGQRKGNQKADFMGVKNVDNNKMSGVNLSKLGLGVGKVLDKSSDAAIRTNFRDSAGGAGGGSGSGKKNYGFGGSGQTGTVGIAGSGGAQGFNGGSGGLLSGEGGTGGFGGTGIGTGRGDGRGQLNISIPEGDPGVSGGLTSQEVMQVIRANLNQIRHCYEQLLQRSPNARGKIGVNFVIGLDGRVTSVSVSESTISDSQMRSCVTGKVQRWDFPKPRGGQNVTVKYPFVFSPI